MEKKYDDSAVMRMVLRYQETGDRSLHRSIIEQMQPLVRAAARKYGGREPLEDLEGEGYIGLLRAIDRFRPGSGARFSTFAMHLIRGQIRHYLRDRGHLIRQPAWVQELDARLEQAFRSLEQRLHREPSTEELATELNLTEEAVEELLSARRLAHISPITASPDDDDSFLELDAEKIRSRDYQTLRLPIEDRIALERAISRLKRLEREVIYHIFYRDLSQSETARHLGISPNYTGYLLKRGMARMREILFGASQENEPLSDTLAGFYSFSYFCRRMEEEIRRCRDDHGFGLIELRLPPAATARSVSQCAGLLRAYTRIRDLRCRRNERTFLLLLPDTGKAAFRVAADLAALLEQDTELRISRTVVLCPQEGRTVEALLALAEASEMAAPGDAVQPVFVQG